MGIWDAVRPLFVSDVVAALRAVVADLDSGLHMRAVAFWNLYVDGEQVHFPTLAAALEPTVTRPAGDIYDADWSPADWPDDDIDYQTTELASAVASGEAVMATASASAFDRHERNLRAMLVRAAKDVRADLVGLPGVSPDLAVMFYDHDCADLEQLVQRAVGARAFRSLFPSQDADARERARVDALPLSQRIPHFLSRIDAIDGAINSETAFDRLWAIGSEAVPALVAKLGDEACSWQVARLLAHIGDVRGDVIDALRDHVRRGNDSNWFGSALALLGDGAWLHERLPDPDAVAALCCPYLVSRDDANCALPLDYDCLAAMLDHSAEVAELADAELSLSLSPGRSLCELRRGELATAVAGTEHRHVVIRRHATAVLGFSRFRNGRVVAALRARLDDEDPAVARAAKFGYDNHGGPTHRNKHLEA